VAIHETCEGSEHQLLVGQPDDVRGQGVLQARGILQWGQREEVHVRGGDIATGVRLVTAGGQGGGEGIE